MPPSGFPEGFVPGRLRLKGDTGPAKKKKKKSKTTSTTETTPASASASASATPTDAPTRSDTATPASDTPAEEKALAPRDEESKASSTPLDREKAEAARYAGMTATQIAFEKRRRERLERQIKREGVKSHKENVEQFNKKLSEQSEHHDMPRIGPG